MRNYIMIELASLYLCFGGSVTHAELLSYRDTDNGYEVFSDYMVTISFFGDYLVSVFERRYYKPVATFNSRTGRKYSRSWVGSKIKDSLERQKNCKRIANVISASEKKKAEAGALSLVGDL